MEYIEGDCEKLSDIINNNNKLIKKLEHKLNFKLENIQSEFSKIGINYTLDSSVIWNKTKFTIIDFATTNPTDFEPII